MLHMKRFVQFISFALLTIAFSAPPTRAQWQIDGVKVSNGASPESVEGRRAVADGAGGILITWRKPIAANNSDVYVQRLDPSGTPMWTTGGVLVCSAIGHQFESTVVSDGAGGAIVFWEDQRTGVTDVYARRVNASGVPQWASDGVAVCTAPAFQADLHAIQDGFGGAIVAWIDARNSFTYPDTDVVDIYAQRINSAGAPQWASNGVAVCVGAQPKEGPSIATDGSGGAIIAWPNVVGTSENIYGQRISAAGSPQWVINGIPLTAGAVIARAAHVADDGAGGAFVAWADSRNGPYDVYSQRVNSAGLRQWVSDVALCIAPDDQYVLDIKHDGAGRAYAVWLDYRAGAGQEDVYAQQVNSSGAIQWGASGAAICTASGTQVCYQLACDGTSGAFFAWHDGRGVNTDIYVQKMSVAGVPQWTPNGVAICAATGNQITAQIVWDGTGGAIVSWYDGRSGVGERYAQRVNSGGQPYPLFTVFKTTDDNSIGTLRRAINDANTLGLQTVRFAIPGAGVHTISPLSPLPPINNIMTIDGFTQPGASPNTNPVGSPSNAQIMIELKGNLAGLTDGLVFNSDGTVRGLALNNWDDAIQVNEVDVVIEGNYIGTDVTGYNVGGNQNGVHIQSIGRCRVGGSQPLARNVISGNAQNGIRMDGGSESEIYGNYIGVAVDGTTPLQNGYAGIRLMSGSHDNLIGSSTVGANLNASQANVIAFNQNFGVVEEGVGTVSNLIVGNSIHDHGIRGIEVGNDGMSYNNVSVYGASGTQVDGNVYAATAETIYLHFYRSPVCGGSSGNGEGKVYIGGLQVNVATGGSLFLFTPAQPIPPASYITVTRTDGALNTSEFTVCVLSQNTPPGPNVPVPLVDAYGNVRGTATFDNVTATGNTFVTWPYLPNPVLSGGFYAGDPSDPDIYFNVTTNASYAGGLEVCLTYDESSIPGPETDLQLVHYNGSYWQAVTTSRDLVNNTICGRVSSLSPFAIAVSTATPIEDKPLPSEFALHANVPNPFNPQTTIQYDIPSGGADVNIAIYDVAGRMVRELVNEHRNAGTWSVQWNGDDDRGGRVASGVYFYRMRAGSFVETKKMVLLK